MTVAIVSGALGNKPGNGGNAWSRLGWVLGLRRLGFDVWFVEQIDFDGRPGDSPQVAFAADVAGAFGLDCHMGLIDSSGTGLWGVEPGVLEDVAAEAELLVNISGHLTVPALKKPARCRVYLDDDPGYTQMWTVSGHGGARLDDHDLYLTFGTNIGQPSCPVPTAGLTWHPVLPPVVLDFWPEMPTSGLDRFTTVGSWRGPYGPVTFGDTTYGLKVHEFRRFLELPGRTGLPFEAALDFAPEDGRDRAEMSRHGWVLKDPADASSTPERFRQYVQSSGAEFSAAQGIYVQTQSGWFSDRTARYLASGRPALVQDTGIGRAIPAGDGLVTFTTLEEAAAGALAIAADHEHHCRAARALASGYLDSDVVLRGVLELAQVAP